MLHANLTHYRLHFFEFIIYRAVWKLRSRITYRCCLTGGLCAVTFRLVFTVNWNSCLQLLESATVWYNINMILNFHNSCIILYRFMLTCLIPSPNSSLSWKCWWHSAGVMVWALSWLLEGLFYWLLCGKGLDFITVVDPKFLAFFRLNVDLCTTIYGNLSFLYFS